MSIFLDDSKVRERLFPFTLTRHVADIRIGITTIREKWAHLTGKPIVTDAAEAQPDDITLPANVIPTKENFEHIIAEVKSGNQLVSSDEVKVISYPWELFLYNDWALRKDYDLLTAGRTSLLLAGGNKCKGEENIFLEEGAVVDHCLLNAETGPIYIGKNAVIMEGSMIRGPFSLGENAVVKMGAKIYGATTVGPYCVVGGEIKNSILFAHSNKAHDGYLGDSVIGEWCNIGAGSSNSNVKNTGGIVKYSMDKEGLAIPAGNKAGLLMGDYSRVAINTSFNTGTIVGVCCNIFGTPGKLVNNFSWGDERYIFGKALNDIRNWKKMKGQDLNDGEIRILENLYNQNL